MRTNIVLDEELVEKARQLTGIKTKKDLIHEALRLMIRLGQQGQVRGLRGKLNWEGDLAELRQSRFQDE
jgi:Arc/MetJ family transcription regulator